MSRLGLGHQGHPEHCEQYTRSMTLADLVRHLPGAKCIGDMGVPITGISYDSRAIKRGEIFVALRGSAQDGHEYIADAVARGARAVVAERSPVEHIPVPMILVGDSRAALARLASVYYEWPQRQLSLIGITGTNGKTTTTYILEAILAEAGQSPAVIGTINYRYGNMACPAPVTTPESLDLMRSLRKVVDSGATHALVEVSSHALSQGRVADCRFRVGVFTNLSRDHLDYHDSMESYFQAKSLLFTTLVEDEQGRGAAVINADSPYGHRLAEIAEVPVTFYGLKKRCQVTATDVNMGKGGLNATLITPQGKMKVSCSLVGRFNLYNVLAATATSLCLDIPLEAISKGLSRIRGVPGRAELISNKLGITVVVDYAHSPDALEKVLGDLRPLAQGRVITVFGCGGDRDKGKRPEMGSIAVTMSDMVVITSDNPRTEDPLSIIQDIVQGVCRTQAGGRYVIEPDREKAIELAIGEARQGDLVLIAGKGHEDYQMVGRQKRHFDDREIAAKILAREE